MAGLIPAEIQYRTKGPKGEPIHVVLWDKTQMRGVSVSDFAEDGKVTVVYFDKTAKDAAQAIVQKMEGLYPKAAVKLSKEDPSYLTDLNGEGPLPKKLSASLKVTGMDSTLISKAIAAYTRKHPKTKGAVRINWAGAMAEVDKPGFDEGPSGRHLEHGVRGTRGSMFYDWGQGPVYLLIRETMMKKFVLSGYVTDLQGKKVHLRHSEHPTIIAAMETAHKALEDAAMNPPKKIRVGGQVYVLAAAKKFHLYDWNKGRLIKSFDDLSKAKAFAEKRLKGGEGSEGQYVFSCPAGKKPPEELSDGDEAKKYGLRKELFVEGG